MTTEQWILQLLLGGILGMVGQGLRVVAGLKKMNDQGVRDNKTFSEMFQTSAMLSSLMIGFIAGAVAVIVSVDVAKAAAASYATDKTTIVTLITAGYAGTDFIEGFVKKYLPGGGDGGGGGTTPTVPPAAADEPAVG